MNNARFGNYAKLIAFFVVAVLLVIGFGFATEGWWQEDVTDDENAISDIPNQNIPSGTPNNTPSPDVPVITVPKFVNAITGLESTEDDTRKRHFAFVLDCDSPLNGISGCDLIAEFPTEADGTRLLALTNNLDSISKIGSLAPTRVYISNVARFFGSVIVANGNDGRLSAEGCNTGGALFDMTAYSGYYYTEYSKFTYTNGQLINAGIYNANINTTAESDLSVPYDFIQFGNETSAVGSDAKSVIVPYNQKSETELYYQNETKCYTLYKNGASKRDALNDKQIGFKNLFILLCDTVTYEESDTTELVMKTIGSGTGFYICDGVSKSITWESDSSGKLTFFDESGQKIQVARGNSYLGFVKSSKIGEIKIS